MSRARIFLSHATPDQPFIEEHVLPVLAGLDAEVFYCKDDITGADDWQERLRVELPRDEWFLLIGSEEATRPERLVRTEVGEWYRLHGDGAGLVVARIDDADLGPIDLRLQHRHQIDLRTPGSEADDALLRSFLAPSRPPSDDGRTGRELGRRRIDPALRASYLGWLRRATGEVATALGGTTVHAPLAEAPLPDRLLLDDAGLFSRQQEAEHVDRRARRLGAGDGAVDADEARTRALADRPVPLYLGPDAHLDTLDQLDTEVWTADDLARRCWRGVVLGDPGAGKSTLARRLVLDAAVAAADDPVAGRLPVVCRASALAAALGDADGPVPVEQVAIGLGWDNDLPLDPDSGDPLPAADLAALAAEHATGQRLLLVVDGLDEVPTEDDRRRLVAALDAFADVGGSRLGTPATATGNQVLVTSRVAGYHAAHLGERFTHLFLGPLSPDGVAAVTRFWLGALAEQEGFGDAQREAMAGQVDELRRLRVSGVGQVVGNPFLLTSTLSAIASGRLDPSRRTGRWRRVELYETALHDAEERGRERVGPAATRAALVAQLAVGHELHRRAPSGVVSRDVLEEVVAEVTADLAGEDRAALGPDPTTTLLAGLGLITERGHGLYGPLHLSIQEDLAARWIAERDDPATAIADHLGDPRWVEPLKLALGHLSAEPGRLAEVVDALLDGPGAGLAARVLVEALDDLATLDAEQVEAVVLAACRDPEAVGARASQVVVDLHRRLRDPGSPFPDLAAALPAGLCAALAEGGDTTRTAARVVRDLGLHDRAVLDALSAAQVHDDESHGWEITRALATTLTGLASPRQPRGEPDQRAGGDASPADTDDASPADADARSADEELSELLSGVRLVPSAEPAEARSRRRRGLSSTAVPFATALRERPATVERIRSSPSLLRLVLALYGGLDHLDVEARQLAYDLLAQEDQADIADPATGWALATRRDLERHALDVALATPPRFDPALMAVDSPLTDLGLLDQLGEGAEPDALASWLAERRDDPDQPAAVRGDAAVAVLALGLEADPTLPADLDPAAEARAAWRLGRLQPLLADALARTPPAELVRGLPVARGQHASELAAHVEDAVLRALVAVAEVRTSVDPDRRLSLDETIPLVAATTDTDRLVADLAPVIDAATSGERWRLAIAVAGLPGAALLPLAHRIGWDVDPLAAGVDQHEVMTVLGELPAPFQGMRCGLVNWLAENTTDAHTEALVLVLDGNATWRAAALQALASLVRAGAPLDGLSAGELDTLAAAALQHLAAQPLPEPVRAAAIALDRRLLALLADDDRDAATVDEVRAALRVTARHQRTVGLDHVRRLLDGSDTAAFKVLRALELGLELGAIEPGEATADVLNELVDQMDDPDLTVGAALARARTARWALPARRAELLGRAIAQAGEATNAGATAAVLLRLAEVAADDPGLSALHDEAVARLDQPEARAAARRRTFAGLATTERWRAEPNGDGADRAAAAWTIEARRYDPADPETIINPLRLTIALVRLLAAGEGACPHLDPLLTEPTDEVRTMVLQGLAGLDVYRDDATTFGWPVHAPRYWAVNDACRAIDNLSVHPDPATRLALAEAMLPLAVAGGAAVPLLALLAALDEPGAADAIAEVVAACDAEHGPEVAAAARSLADALGGEGSVGEPMRRLAALPPLDSSPGLVARSWLVLLDHGAPPDQVVAAARVLADDSRARAAALAATPDDGRTEAIGALAEAVADAAVVAAGLGLRATDAPSPAGGDVTEAATDLAAAVLDGITALGHHGGWLQHVVELEPTITADLHGRWVEAMVTCRRTYPHRDHVRRRVDALLDALDPPGPVPWAALTLAAIVHDERPPATTTSPMPRQHPGGEASAPTPGSADAEQAAPGHRDRLELRTLDQAGTARIDARLDEDDPEGAAALLRSRAYGAGSLGALERWRRKDARVGALAALLLLEAGVLDDGVLDQLPALLSTDDDLVRLRAQLAIERAGPVVQRCARTVTATTCGPGVLARLARLRADPEHPQLGTEATWAMHKLVVDDVDGALRDALGLLDDEPAARLGLLKNVRAVDPRVVEELGQLLGRLDDADQRPLLLAMAAMADDGAGGHLTDADVRRWERPLLQVVEEGTDAAAAWAVEALGNLYGGDGTRHELLDLLDEPTDEVAGAAARALARAVQRDPSSGPGEREEVAARLWPLARRSGERRPVGAVAGLVLLGLEVEREATDLDPATVLWGLLTAVDRYRVNASRRDAVRRAARYVVDPPHLSGRARAAHTAGLVTALVDEAQRRVGAVETTGALDYWTVFDADVLHALAEVGVQQPATLREALAERPALRAGLPEVARSAGDWLVRAGATALVGLGGHGDTAAVGALLDALVDADPVARTALTNLAWIDRVDPEALQVLLDALEAPSALRAYGAAQALRGLATGRALDATQRADAVAALRRAMAGGGADRLVYLAPYGAGIQAIGRLGTAIRTVLASLEAGDTTTTATSGSWTLEVPTSDGAAQGFALPHRLGPRAAARFRMAHLWEHPPPGVDLDALAARLDALDRLRGGQADVATLAERLAAIADPT